MENKGILNNMTIENLQEEIKKTEHRIEVEEHRKNLTLQKMKQAERKARTHRLIVMGAELEKVLPGVKALREDEVQSLLSAIAGIREVQNLMAWVVRYFTGSRTEAPQ